MKISAVVSLLVSVVDPTFMTRRSSRIAMAFLAFATFAVAALPARAQAVWTGADDRGPFWSNGKVVDAHGNVLHVGNWGAARSRERAV